MHYDSALDRETSVAVERGLYLLRYVSAPSSLSWPVAVARAAPGCESQITLISPPGVVAGFLAGPGASVVLKVEQGGRLLIKVKRQNDTSSLDASFQIEPISGEARPNALVTVTGSAQVGFAGFGLELAGKGAVGSREVAAVPLVSLLAHVARRGDVEVGAGVWAAGPESPAAIEGFEIRGPQRPGLRVEAQAMALTRPTRWLDWVPQGVFAGSRGRALPLGGLRLRLAGEAAEHFTLAADALFLGSPIASKRGRELEFVSAAGADPLVGLRLAILPEKVTHVSGAVAAAPRGEPRVRVFRATTG